MQLSSIASSSLMLPLQYVSLASKSSSEMNDPGPTNPSPSDPTTRAKVNDPVPSKVPEETWRGSSVLSFRERRLAACKSSKNRETRTAVILFSKAHKHTSSEHADTR
ncbi:hypothetical protein BD311DRAFT_346288 [Dichomitus squalens]|uniref:Uncharacterized protein n=1 Tax=Dichomitus squalens TaxID=114155 RepID=A0A4Q9N5Q1_9APHY|nr:hypothetical protein BD311DRAFT_346288 [Dichomitus squalens]